MIDYKYCPSCGITFSKDNWEWSNGVNESGTDYYSLDVECHNCEWTYSGGCWGGFTGEEDDIEGEYHAMVHEEKEKQNDLRSRILKGKEVHPEAFERWDGY